MLPDDPRHGKPAGREQHRLDGEDPCYPCRVAWAEYASNRYRQIAYGRWQPYVDAEPARQHVRELIAAGMPYRKVASAANVDPRRVSALLYGRGQTPPTRKIRPDFSSALLALRPEPSRVPSLGAARRLRALMALGHAPGALARELGITYTRLEQLGRGDGAVIMRETHDRIADLYDRLAMVIPEPMNRYERQAFSRTRSRAKLNGWAPPLAWDDIDDPDERPKVSRMCEVGGCQGKHWARGFCRRHYETDRRVA